jgi:endogenous inhibitor of DNA gyrase (YacG/DUF329 family)
MGDPRPAQESSSGRVVRCPGCGGESLYAPSNPHRPFCSARCRNSDLGAWATEDYRVAAEPPAGDGDVADAAPPPRGG